jgi:hypothetical protein
LKSNGIKSGSGKYKVKGGGAIDAECEVCHTTGVCVYACKCHRLCSGRWPILRTCTRTTAVVHGRQCWENFKLKLIKIHSTNCNCCNTTRSVVGVFINFNPVVISTLIQTLAISQLGSHRFHTRWTKVGKN